MKKQLLITILVLPLVYLLIACSENQNQQSATSQIAPASTTSTKNFSDGAYVYNSRVEKGTETCNSGKEQCLSLEDYKLMCAQITSITQGMNLHLTAAAGADEAFKKLLDGGRFDGVDGQWLDKSYWKPESGILGACEVTISVSGIFEGTDTRAKHKVFAKEFIVDKGEVLLHGSSSGSAYML